MPTTPEPADDSTARPTYKFIPDPQRGGRSRTPAEHYAEAERLCALASDSYMNPEGGYDDTSPPTTEELATRAAIAEDARKDAMLYLAEAQVHATLAMCHALMRGRN